MRHLSTFVRKYSFHPNANTRSIITLLYVTIGLIINFFYLQIFCMPVLWAGIYSTISLLSVLLFPFIKNNVLKTVFYFLIGAASLPCIYGILFLSDPWAYFTGYLFFTIEILFFGAGLLAFIPAYLLWHIYQYLKQSSHLQKTVFYTGVIIPLLVLAMYLHKFKQDYNSLCTAYQTNTVSQLKPTYIHEQLLGIGYKYHTKLEYIYDGWRPPMHNPFLNIGLWIYSESYFPFCRQIQPFTQLDRPHYYKLLFPQRSLIVDCPCSYTRDGRLYFNDTASFR